MTPKMRAVLSIGALLTAFLPLLPAGAQKAKIAEAQAPRSVAGKAPDRRASLDERRKAEKHFLAGARAFERNRLAGAEREFLRAEALDPANQRYIQSAEITRQFLVAQLLDREAQAGRGPGQTEAQSAFSEARQIDPQNPLVAQYIAPPEPEAAGTQVSFRSERGSEAPPEPEAEKAVRSFHLRMNERELIRQVLGAYGIRVSVDQSVASDVVRFDATGVVFSEAVRLAELATGTFVVPLDAHDVLVLADTRQNRSKYQPLAAETVSFPGMTNLELSDMESVARNVLGIQQAVMDPARGTITVRAPEAELDALNQVCAELMKGRSEVQLEIHVFEVDRSHEADAGVVFPNSATLFNVRSEVNSALADNASLIQEIISSGAAAAGDWQKIIAILVASGALSGTVFNNPFVVLGGGLTETGAEWNTAAANMLLSSSDVKSLNQIQLRVTDQEEATFRVGERYPIMTAAYSMLSGAGYSSSQTVPQVQYADLGLTLKARPFVEGSGDVTLHLDLEVDSLAGPTLNDIPVLTNRQYSGVVSVRPGYSALVVSAISKQDTQELTGVPGLSDIPGLNDATNRQDTTGSTELVILITPHIVRASQHGAAGPMQILPRN